SDNAQIKAKLAALSGGADFKGISQRLNEKLTLVLKTLDHKKSARDGGSLLSERLVSFFAGSWTNYIKALKDNKDVADASRALEHAAGNTSHETRELAEQLIRYSSQLDEPDIREELFQMWDFYNQHVLIPNNLYGILPIGYDDEKNWYFYGSILYKIEYQEIHRINDKKKVEVLFGRRFSNPTEANIPQAGHSLDEMPVVFIDIDQIQETVSAFRDTLEGNLVPYGIPEVAEWIRNTYRDWNDEQILEEVKNNTVIHELAHQAFDEMKYRYIQEDGFGISPKVWRQMQLYESDLIEQEVGAYLVEMALIRDPASVLEILIRPFLEGRPEEESYVGQYLFNRLSGKKVGDPWVERGKRDGIIRLFTDLTASPLLGQRADQILREDFSNFNLPTFVKLDDQGGAARDGGSQEKKLAALKRALKERERKGYSNHPAAFFRGEHVDRALYRLALDLERKHGVTLLPRKRVSFDLDHPDTVVRVQRALKKREKKGWSNTPGQLQKGEHADPPLYDWAIAVEERNKITLLPRKRVSFDLTDPDTLERVQNALKEREKKWGEKANSPGQLQKGEHPDYSVYNWAVTLEKKHGIILLSRERVSRSWDTLEGWRNYIDERIATGKKITSSGLANAVSAGPLKKLRQIEREQGVQLILRRQGGLPEFGAFSAQVGQLVWDRFHPAKKIDPEKGAREIVQVLQSRAWQEQLMLLSLFNRHDRLKDRTQAFLKTKVGQKWLKELNEPIRKEVVHMVLWTTQKEHLQATYRVLAWITLAPHGSEEMLKQIQSSEKLRNRWPLFLETELGQRVYSSLKDTERVSEQKVALTADEEELLAYLRSQKKPVSPSRMAQEVHLSERNGSVAAVEELVRNLERKKIPISRTEAGSLFLTKTQSRSKAIRSEGVKDGAARQWIPSPRISSIHPSRDLLLTTYP
ncbi:MAG: hypothetical protein HY590_07150, partial [Candidatus Omnitrophica bacterium]|nr:hypothetical protein [Candidatus Omnitrophota bacterium]